MKRVLVHLPLLATALLVAPAPHARAADDGAPTPVPVVTVSASATTSVPNDRLHAWLRAEADHTSAAQAAAEVNTRVARALPRLRSLPDVHVATSGYATQQIVEKGKPSRWRVVQTIKVEGSDFAAIGDAAGRLQAEEGLRCPGSRSGCPRSSSGARRRDHAAGDRRVARAGSVGRAGVRRVGVARRACEHPDR